MAMGLRCTLTRLPTMVSALCKIVKGLLNRAHTHSRLWTHTLFPEIVFQNCACVCVCMYVRANVCVYVCISMSISL